MKTKALSLLFLSIITISVQAQEIKKYKGTDIFLFDLNLKSSQILTNGKNITERDGYDNQPSFSPDGKSVLYTSILDKQADIYEYVLSSGQRKQITSTPDVSEYSPTFIPNTNNFSVVMVEKDGVQRLWQYSRDGKFELTVKEILPVGYYVWKDENTLAMFVLGEHNTLHILNKATRKHTIVKADIGRSLQRIPDRNEISFVDKKNENSWMIKSLAMDSFKETEIVKTIKGSEDYIWTPDGKIIMGSNSKLFIYDPLKKREWQEIADLKDYGVNKILRLAINSSGDKIAIVNDNPEK